MVVLLSKQGRRHQHGNLLVVVARDKRGSHCYLGFAEAYVAADQPVHDFLGAHVISNCLNGEGLVWCFFKGEARAEAFVV